MISGINARPLKKNLLRLGLDATTYAPLPPGSVQTTVTKRLNEQLSGLTFFSAAQKADYFARSETLDCTAAVQAIEDYVSGIGGGAIFWPSGNARHNSMIVRKTGTVWSGGSKEGTQFVYYGTGTAFDCEGTNPSRKQLAFRNMTLRSSAASNGAKCLKLAWNQRGSSMQMFENVRMFNFGHYGIEFVGPNWLVHFDIEMDSCGTFVAGSSGMYKAAAVQDLADLKFTRLVVEDCGTDTSVAGGINFPCVGNRISGLWIDNATIENNRSIDGTLGGGEMYFQNSDVLFSALYTESTQFGALKPNSLVLDNCVSTISLGRLANSSAFANYGIVAKNGTLLTGVDGCEFNQNQTLGDIFVDATSKLYDSNLSHRIVKGSATTSKVFGRQPSIWAIGVISDGRAGVAGFFNTENMVSCVRTGVGAYTWTWLNPCQDSAYHVDVACDYISTGVGLIANVRHNTKTNTSVQIYTSVGTVSTDCEGMSVQITQRLIG